MCKRGRKKENDARTTVTIIWEESQNRKQGKRKEIKDKRKNGNKERKKKKKQKVVRQACTNRLFPSLLLKILPSAKSKKGSSGHQPFKSVSLKTINFRGLIFLGD